MKHDPEATPNLVVWRCKTCHLTCSGFLAPLQSTLRFCPHPTRDTEGYPAQCGEVLEVVLDERRRVEGPLTQMASQDSKRSKLAVALKVALAQLYSGRMTVEQVVAGMKGWSER